MRNFLFSQVMETVLLLETWFSLPFAVQYTFLPLVFFADKCHEDTTLLGACGFTVLHSSKSPGHCYDGGSMFS